MMPRKHSLDERKHGLDIHNYELGDCKEGLEISVPLIRFVCIPAESD